MEDQALRTARVAVVGLRTTTGRPPLIVETTVYHLDGGCIAGGPYGYWSAVDVPRREVPSDCWPNLHDAPPWAETAVRLAEVLANRVLVVHDRDRWEILRRHLPDWQPAGLAFTGDLAGHVWPDLADWSLGAVAARAGIPGIMPGVARSAIVEAQVIALLLGRLVVELGQAPAAQGLRGSPARCSGRR